MTHLFRGTRVGGVSITPGRVSRALRVAVPVTAVTAGSFSYAGPTDAAVPNAPKCLVAAHRGNTNVPNTTATENTLTAFHRAVAAKAEILEMDVAATSDDALVLMHDPTVDRTTNGTGTVRSKTAAQINELTTKDGYSGKFDAAGRPIAGPGGVPFLSDVIPYAMSQGKKVLVEIKAAGGTTWWQHFAARVNSYPGGVILQSFHRADMDKAKTVVPGVPVTLISATQVSVPTLAGLNGIVIGQDALTAQYRASLDAANLQIHPYTEKSSTTWQRDLGKVSSIITNSPAALVAFRATDRACPQFPG
jgi:glycerophosphoryl diester phosphodiesterase